ncbi:helix-turn-helix domain-containing protein, partial [Lactiplantibacillus pentosus]
MTVVYQIIGSKSKILNSFLALYHTREEAGLTQADLAERANVPQSTIARIERGDNVTFDKL